MVGLAIAYDTVSNGTETTTSPLTWSHTCTGSNLILVTGVNIGNGSSPNCSGVTYNSVSLTLVGSERLYGSSLGQISLWYLLNPATGANTVSVSFSGTTVTCDAGAVSYSGVAQSGQPDAIAGTTDSTASNPSVTVTTIADNCWVAGLLGNVSGPSTANLTERYTPNASTYEGSYQDTNAVKTPAGDQAVGWTDTVPGSWSIQAASFAPVTGGTAVKDIIQEGIIPFTR